MVSFRPLVSVIVPAFNVEKFIGETLDSILGQSYENLEIIVVDDGSTDNTSQIVQGYGTSLQYFFQKNSGGCSIPRNSGIERSSGEFICFIDADDIMLQDRIAIQIDFMTRHPEIGLVFSDYRNFDETGPCRESHFQACPRLWPRLCDYKEVILKNPCHLLAQENFGIAGSFMMRRDLLKYEAGFEPSLRSCEDFHFYFRLARHTPVGVINKVGMLRRIHGRNMSGNVATMRSEGIRSRTLLRDSEQDAEIRLHLNQYIDNCRGNLARYYANQGQYLQSLKYDLRVLTGPLFSYEARMTWRNILRTIAMVGGLHRPAKE